MTDYSVGSTIYLMFTTSSFSTGAPTQLAGVPVVSAYENDSLTQITAGITLGVDHDGITGLNLLTIIATGANGYEAGKDYNMVVTTGTVDGVSWVGEVVGTFSLERSSSIPQHALTQGLAKYIGPYGAGIYYNDGAANTNTTLGTDGTYDNPVSTLAAATTLATSLGAARIYVAGQSTLTLTGQTLTDYDIVGLETTDAATVNLGTAASQSTLTRCRIINCTVYGEHDASDRLDLERCFITDAPTAEVTFLHCFAIGCGLLGNFELDTSSNNVFERCYSMVPGDGYPVCTATGAAGTVVFRHYSGGIGFQNLSASHTGSVETAGQVVFESGCNVNATFALRGNLTIVDNTAGMNNLTITATAQNLNDKIDTVDTVADAILVDTTSLNDTKIPDTISLANINAEIDTAFTSQMADSVPMVGTIATREQALYMILQFLTEKGAAGTAVTVRKVDGSTALMTLTLDNATTPTDITRAT